MLIAAGATVSGREAFSAAADLQQLSLGSMVSAGQASSVTKNVGIKQSINSSALNFDAVREFKYGDRTRTTDDDNMLGIPSNMDPKFIEHQKKVLGLLYKRPLVPRLYDYKNRVQVPTADICFEKHTELVENHAKWSHFQRDQYFNYARTLDQYFDTELDWLVVPEGKLSNVAHAFKSRDPNYCLLNRPGEGKSHILRQLAFKNSDNPKPMWVHLLDMSQCNAADFADVERQGLVSDLRNLVATYAAVSLVLATEYGFDSEMYMRWQISSGQNDIMRITLQYLPTAAERSQYDQLDLMKALQSVLVDNQQQIFAIDDAKEFAVSKDPDMLRVRDEAGTALTTMQQLLCIPLVCADSDFTVLEILNRRAREKTPCLKRTGNEVRLLPSLRPTEFRKLFEYYFDTSFISEKTLNAMAIVLQGRTMNFKRFMTALYLHCLQNHLQRKTVTAENSELLLCEAIRCTIKDIALDIVREAERVADSDAVSATVLKRIFMNDTQSRRIVANQVLDLGEVAYDPSSSVYLESIRELVQHGWASYDRSSGFKQREYLDTYNTGAIMEPLVHVLARSEYERTCHVFGERGGTFAEWAILPILEDIFENADPKYELKKVRELYPHLDEHLIISAIATMMFKDRAKLPVVSYELFRELQGTWLDKYMLDVTAVTSLEDYWQQLIHFGVTTAALMPNGDRVSLTLPLRPMNSVNQGDMGKKLVKVNVIVKLQQVTNEETIEQYFKAVTNSNTTPADEYFRNDLEVFICAANTTCSAKERWDDLAKRHKQKHPNHIFAVWRTFGLEQRLQSLILHIL